MDELITRLEHPAHSERGVMDLIEKLKRATGPSQELDNVIAEFIGLKCPDDPAGWPPCFSHSIDAALTLLPEKHYWELKCAPHRKGYIAKLWDSDGDTVMLADSPTPAIALCLAALKAHKTC